MADGLRRLDGVANVEVDLQSNVCTVTPAADRVPALAGLPLAVHQAGYRAGRLWIRARGEVRVVGDGHAFRIDGTQMQLPLVGPLPGSQPAGAVFEARVEFRPEAVLLAEAAPPDQPAVR